MSDIFVRFGADIDPLKKGAKEAGELIKDVGKSGIETAKKMAALTAAAAATGAAITAIASNSAKGARELQNLSRLSNVATSEFQAMAMGAKTVGIEQDKLADIFKDTQDKVGDFIANGGGPLADFFDNIAPKVGVASEQFKNLSGPDALGLYVSSLEKANLSQSEMIFYMEAIASDSSALLPLLQNNAAGMKSFADQAKELGFALTDIEIAKLDNMQKTLDAAGMVAGSLVDKFSAELAPVIDELAQGFLDWTKSVGGVDAIVDSTVDGIISGFGMAANVVRGLDVVIEGLKLSFNGASVAVNVFATKLIENIDWAINSAKEVINGFIDAANNIPGINLDRLVTGKGALAESMRASLDAAKDELSKQTDAFNQLLLAPMPSDAIEARLESIRAKNDLEVQAELDKQAQLAGVADAARAEQLAKQSAFEQAMAEIKTAWGREQTDATKQIFSDLSVLMQSNSKKQFEIGKAAARVNTVISTYEGAQKAFTSLAGIPVVGPALGTAAAAAAIAAGGIRLQAINSTSFGGGGSVSAGAGGAGAAASASTAAAPAQAAEPSRTVRVDTLDPTALVSGAVINKLAEQLAEYQEDGFKLVV